MSSSEPTGTVDNPLRRQIASMSPQRYARAAQAAARLAKKLGDTMGRDVPEDVLALTRLSEGQLANERAKRINTPINTDETPPARASEVEPVAVEEPAPVAELAPPPEPRIYTVVSGDTLWAIAERFYGDGNQYQRIADASGVADPDLIQVGQVLAIPAAGRGSSRAPSEDA